MRLKLLADYKNELDLSRPLRSGLVEEYLLVGSAESLGVDLLWQALDAIEMEEEMWDAVERHLFPPFVLYVPHLDAPLRLLRPLCDSGLSGEDTLVLRFDANAENYLVAEIGKESALSPALLERAYRLDEKKREMLVFDAAHAAELLERIDQRMAEFKRHDIYDGLLDAEARREITFDLVAEWTRRQLAEAGDDALRRFFLEQVLRGCSEGLERMTGIRLTRPVGKS